MLSKTALTRGVRWFIASTALVGSAQAELPPLALKKFAEGLASPLGLIPYPDGKSLAVWDQAGVAYLFDADGSNRRALLDLRDKLTPLKNGFDERGLLGMAFHPKFAENGKLYVYYSAKTRESAGKEFHDPAKKKNVPANWDHTSHLSVFTVKDGKADPAGERVLLQVDEPQFNHNSGRLLFGPDGYLYVSLGDGGAANDFAPGHVEGGNGQYLETLLGKVLRLDVDKGEPYGIPQDNPLVGKPGRDEIYAWGLRNPWGMCLDPDNPKQIILADVGQNRFEEVNVITRGGNYGWNTREGFDGFDPMAVGAKSVDKPKTDASGQPLIDPVLAYKSVTSYGDKPDAMGCSITGGYVYQGAAIPALKGKYVFGDWKRLNKGCLYMADRSTTPWKLDPLPVDGHPDGRLDVLITAFGEDHAKELYVLTNGGDRPSGDKGAIWKLAPK